MVPSMSCLLMLVIAFYFPVMRGLYMRQVAVLSLE